MDNTSKVALAAVVAFLISRSPVKPTPGNGDTPVNIGKGLGTAINGLEGDISLFQPGGRKPQLNDGYYSPSVPELAYFVGKKMTVFRLQDRWELMQPVQFGALDPLYMGLHDTLLGAAADRGVQWIPTPFQSYVFGPNGWTTGYFNFNTMTGHILGTAGCSYEAFANFWKTVAQYYADRPQLRKGIFGYALCNEPHDMIVGGLSTTQNWFNAAQAAILAIRQVDTGIRIIVNGSNYGTAQGWVSPSWCDCDPLKNLVDPGNNLLYEAHEYSDDGHQGRYEPANTTQSGTPYDRGPARIKVFTDWLRANGKNGIIGEYGVPPHANESVTPWNQYWLDCLDATLAYYLTQSDVLKSFQYHAAGLGWSEMSIEPIGGVDRPQMNVFEKYL